MVKGKFLILCLVFVLMIPFQCFAQGGEEMKKAVMIIAQENFRDEELLEPKRILQEAGIVVKVAARSLKQASGMLGARVTPDIMLQDINLQDFDAVIFVGGRGASIYWDDPVAHKIADDAHSANKVVAAICIAPVILARAGLLRNRKATVFSSEAGKLRSEGVIYTGKSVEKDGKIITASGPPAATEFAKQILQALSE